MKWVKNKAIDQNKNDLNLILRIGRTNVALKRKWPNKEKSTNLLFRGNYHNFSSYFYFKMSFHINELQTF